MGCCSLASAWASAMPVHRRLKRSRSASMPRKRGRSSLLRWANTVSSLQPLHSSPAADTCTENDISDAAVGTAS